MRDRWVRRCRQTSARILAAGVVLIAASCGSDDGSDDGSDATNGGVHPFSEVQADEFVFESDPTNLERGIFRVTTTEPMICAIVWGATEEFGNFNNSLAMNGTGIVNHDVFLPGAEPGRTHYFQVQGSTADGTLYRSETATFTIPAVDAPPPGETFGVGENLALGAAVLEASSEFSDGFVAANAIDDLGTTEWSSAGDGDDAFITIDLGDEHNIAGFEFITRSMLDGSAITETFTVTIDDQEVLGPFPAGTAVEPNLASVQAAGRLVRFDVDTSTGGNVGAVEVRVFAP
jgi:hypothetical protein